MHTQVERAFVDEVAPSPTNMRELAPQKSDIPILLCVQSIKVEYAEEYIIIDPMDSRILYIVSSLECWRRQS
jgi:hypothetical protein